MSVCVLIADKQSARGDQWKAVSAQSSLLHCVSIFTPYYHIINGQYPIRLTLKTPNRRGGKESGKMIKKRRCREKAAEGKVNELT